MKKLVILSVVALLSACSEQKKESAPSVEQLAIQTPTATDKQDGLRVIRRKRFQEKPVTLREEKPILNLDGSAANAVAFKESTAVKCIDILTLSDGSTRHVNCEQRSQTVGTLDTKNGLMFFSTWSTDARGYSSSYGGMGLSMTHTIRSAFHKHPSRNN